MLALCVYLFLLFVSANSHYANISVKSNFQIKKCNIFLFFVQNIDCGYTLEEEEEENNVHPSKTQFSYIKVGCKGVFFSLTCFHDANDCRNVMVTCPYNEDPLTPNNYIGKLGFTGVYIIFLNLLLNIDCGYSLEPPRRAGSNVYPRYMF